MKMILTSATTPDEYIECLSGWQQTRAAALRAAVRAAIPKCEERLKWGHIVYFMNGPVLLIRAEPTRVLFGFWRGQRLTDIEARLKPGGKYEMATMEMKEDTTIANTVVARLAKAAVKLNIEHGNPAVAVIAPSKTGKAVRTKALPSVATKRPAAKRVSAKPAAGRKSAK